MKILGKHIIQLVQETTGVCQNAHGTCTMKTRVVLPSRSVAFPPSTASASFACSRH